MLVKLVSVNTVKSFYYVGRVIDNEDDSLVVSFYRQSAKAPDSFAMPNVEDISAVEKDDIVMCLPQPIHSATTKRVAASVHFSINLAHFKCQ